MNEKSSKKYRAIDKQILIDERIYTEAVTKRHIETETHRRTEWLEDDEGQKVTD